MKIVGLTGGIASGKSTLAEMLREKGAIIIDADKIGREQAEVGKPVYQAIVNHFGSSILNSDGTVNRRELGRVVFSNPGKLSMLNQLTHRPIIEEIEKRLSEIRQAKKSKEIVIVDVPLLIESGLGPNVDSIIIVTSNQKKRIERLRKIGFSEEDARNRIKAQMLDEEKLPYADFVVGNNGPKEKLRTEAENLWSRLIRG